MENTSKDTLRYNVDSVICVQNTIVIQGWVLDSTDTLKIKVYGKKDHEIEYEYNDVERFDVIDAFGLSEDRARCGMQIHICLNSKKEKKLRVVFENKYTQYEYLIDLKRIEEKHSYRSKFKSILTHRGIRGNLSLLCKQGIAKFIYDVKAEIDPKKTAYNYWIKAHKITNRELKIQRVHKFSYEPCISIVIPLFNTPKVFLKDLMDSVYRQSYKNWQLCLADASSEDFVGQYIKNHYGSDKRISYKKLKENKGISDNTDEAIQMAKGEFIMLSDHDDILELDALYEIVKAINHESKPDIIYTDEDKVTFDGKEYFWPHFKPDFNLGLLRSNNYICHITVVKKSIIDKIGGYRAEFDGAQDYDLILRCIEESKNVYHIPKVLYHWRSHPNSTALNPGSKMYAYEAGRKALEEHYKREGINADSRMRSEFGCYKTIMHVQGNPKVSLIILTENQGEELRKSLVSVFEKTAWKNYEVIILDKNSTDTMSQYIYSELENKYPNCVFIHKVDNNKNYYETYDYGVECSTGEYVLFANSNIEVISPDWMERMLGFCQQKDTGVVGAKLYSEDNTIQHVGKIVGLGGVAGNIFDGITRADAGYSARALVTHDLNAVSSACMLVKKAVYNEVNGFDGRYEVDYGDVDLCLKIRDAGYRVIIDPDSKLYNYELKSYDNNISEKLLQEDAERFKQRWKDILETGDPYYNINLSLVDSDCSLREQYSDFAKGRK